MDLTNTIKHALVDIPEYCTTDGVQTHKWVVTYGIEQVDEPGLTDLKTTRMLPYYLCKHCHAVSTDWTTHRYPKRVR